MLFSRLGKMYSIRALCVLIIVLLSTDALAGDDCEQYVEKLAKHMLRLVTKEENFTKELTKLELPFNSIENIESLKQKLTEALPQIRKDLEDSCASHCIGISGNNNSIDAKFEIHPSSAFFKVVVEDTVIQLGNFSMPVVKFDMDIKRENRNTKGSIAYSELEWSDQAFAQMFDFGMKQNPSFRNTIEKSIKAVTKTLQTALDDAVNVIPFPV